MLLIEHLVEAGIANQSALDTLILGELAELLALFLGFERLCVGAGSFALAGIVNIIATKGRVVIVAGATAVAIEDSAVASDRVVATGGAGIGAALLSAAGHFGRLRRLG